MNKKLAQSFDGTERFQILREIGAGGMGVVFEAKDKQRDCKVAIKTLQKMDARALLLFKQEFRSLANITHENLVPLYELISDGNQWFFSMELIADGQSLTRYLTREDLLDFFPVDDVTNSVSASAPTASQYEPEAFDELGETAQTPKPDQSMAPTQVPHTDCIDTLEFEADDRFVNHASEKEGSDPPQVNSDAPEGDERPMCPANLDLVYPTMLQIANGIVALHSHGKLHRDLKPANTMIRSDGRVVLLDFGLVAELQHPTVLDPATDPVAETGDPSKSAPSTAPSDASIAGTVLYMAPEQASAMPLSSAADWYAFGVMLFEILTGRHPFTGTKTEILRRKVTRNGPAPSVVCSGIPEDLDNLCKMLMRRNPKKRPSANEVRSVLSKGTPTRVFSDTGTLNTSTLFVGREHQLATLHDCFARVGNGAGIVCRVHGRSGTGKSSLVDQFLSRLANEQAVILTGRCYEQESVPYKAVDALVDALAKYLSKLPAEEIDALMPDGAAELARIFPVLKRVTQFETAFANASTMVDVRALRTQAFAALREILKSLGATRPLVLYVDDLQWGDVDSAALLTELLRAPDNPQLLMLLAYRSEYTDTSECLRKLRELASKSPDNTFCEVETGPLSSEEATRLTHALLARANVDLQSQIEWIVNESEGNAFFVYELVRHLQSGQDISQIQGVRLDDVLWQRVLRLPDSERALLEGVAISGQPIQLAAVQNATDLAKASPSIVNRLRNENLVRSTGPSVDDDVETFHDRVRESVVGHLSQDRAQTLHASIAKSLAQQGRVAKERLAVHYEHGGMPLEASRNYEAAAEKAMQVLAFDRAEELYRKAAELAESDIRRAAIHEKLIHYYTDTARFEEAYRLGRETTAMFGLHLPAKFVPPLFAVDFLKSKWRMRGKHPKDILNLPDMDDERLAWAARIGNACAKAAYQIKPQLCIAVAMRVANLFFKRGNTPDCAIAYMASGGIFQGGILGLHQAGHDYCQVALDLVEKYDYASQRAEVHFVMGYFCTSWLRPVAEAERFWAIAYEAGLESSDLFHTGCASAGTVLSMWMRGAHTDSILEKAREFQETLERARLNEPIGCVQTVCQAIANLKGQTESRLSMDGNGFTEADYVNELPSYASRHMAHYFYVVRMQLLYLRGEYEWAELVAKQSASFLSDSPGMLHSAEHYFYAGLIAAELEMRDSSRKRRSVLRDALKRFQKWTLSCEDNFSHKSLLLDAELARCQNKTEVARKAYQASRDAAEQFGYQQIVALSFQRESGMEKSLGNNDAANEKLLAAAEAYRIWGVDAYADEIISECTASD